MKLYIGRGGDQRIWFDRVEIEWIAEDELSKAGLMPATTNPVLDVEALIERHLGASLDQYAALPSTILGLTEFRSGEAPQIRINSDLTSCFEAEDAALSDRGRWRATLAHEASHIILHRILFEFDPAQQTMFGTYHEMVPPEPIRCLKREVRFGGSGRDWREVQANKSMGALLMPRRLFLTMAKVEWQILGVADQAQRTSDSPGVKTLVAKLANIFEVSKQAAAIRLQTLGFVTAENHIALSL